ncbi:hypothetical protein KKI23_00825 [Patescibacteria group bacterium]|nr:hypothetical protein [Patescibacteria group bacterium]
MSLGDWLVRLGYLLYAVFFQPLAVGHMYAQGWPKQEIYPIALAGALIGMTIGYFLPEEGWALIKKMRQRARKAKGSSTVSSGNNSNSYNRLPIMIWRKEVQQALARRIATKRFGLLLAYLLLVMPVWGSTYIGMLVLRFLGVSQWRGYLSCQIIGIWRTWVLVFVGTNLMAWAWNYLSGWLSALWQGLQTIF